ncbi:MAG TPA: hypothetical protein VKL21_01120, partial [Candidatus Methanoperedens sp.]|nr:hypothetical protein [Candidatus Methanoperedens sp.]
SNMSDDTIREKKREQKLRFIEILLIVGGIISSLGLQYKSEVFVTILGFFSMAGHLHSNYSTSRLYSR